jgi:hypothetical protein
MPDFPQPENPAAPRYGEAVPWVETPSLSFTARHEASQADDALAVLEDLEQYRARLEQLLPRVPGGVTVVLHDSPVQLLFGNPMLAVMRRVASRAARRYMVGWYRTGEVHTLSPPVLREISAGPDSERALLLSPRRIYTALAIGTNNPLLPPPSRPGPLLHLLREAWLPEGAAQHFAGQVPLMRAAIATRLRAGRIRFPPGARDAALLGGTLFDLLQLEQDERACVRLATHPARDPRAALEDAFGASAAAIDAAWRGHLERLATPAPDVSPVH